MSYSSLLRMSYLVGFGLFAFCGNRVIAQGVATPPPQSKQDSSEAEGKNAIKETRFVPPSDVALDVEREFVGVDEVFILKADRIPVGEPTYFRVTLRNKSKTKIEIDDLTSSCGCLSPMVKSKEIDVNGQTLIMIQIKPESRGDYRKRFTAHLKSGQRLDFIVESFALNLYTLNNERVAFSFASKVSPSLTLRPKFDFHPNLIECEDPAFKIVNFKRMGNRSTFQVEVAQPEIVNSSREHMVSISLCHDGKCKHRVIQLINLDRMEIANEPLIGQYRRGNINIFAIIEGNDFLHQPLDVECTTPDCVIDELEDRAGNNLVRTCVIKIKTPHPDDEEDRLRSLELVFTQGDHKRVATTVTLGD